MKTNFKVALFDLDGVLINSARLIKASFDSVFTHYQISDDPAKWAKTKGWGLQETYEIFGFPDIEAACAMHAEFSSNNFQLVTAFKEAPGVLELLAKSNIQIGVITNRSRNSRLLLKHLGLLSLVDCVIAAEDVKQKKPDPEGIIKAMEYFSCHQEETVMIGDTPVDIQAGKRAGVSTIAINTGDCLDELESTKPDYVIHNLSEVLPIILGK